MSDNQRIPSGMTEFLKRGDARPRFKSGHDCPHCGKAAKIVRVIGGAGPRPAAIERQCLHCGAQFTTPAPAGNAR